MVKVINMVFLKNNYKDTDGKLQFNMVTTL